MRLLTTTRRPGCAAAAVLTLLSLSDLGAQTRWTYAAGRHFEVYTTGGDRVARRTVEDFDRVHAYFEQILRVPPLTGPKARVIVFSNRGEFEPYAANTSVKAFYQSSVDGDFIVLPSLSGNVLPAIMHEYAHLTARRTGNRYPLWLDDGLAEYFSTVTPQGARLKVGAAPPERQRALGFGVRLMPLERLFAITRDSADYNTPSRAGLFYAESWALTHMLVSDERYRGQSGPLFDRLAKGEPSALALTLVYGKPVDEISRDLTRYTLRGNYRTVLEDIALGEMTAGPPTRPATDFEAGVTLASLLAANPNHRARARAAFDVLERENPNDLLFNEAAAMFAVRAGEFDVARPYLSRAMALDSTNARIYSHYAEIRATSPDTGEHDDAEESRLFVQALSLAPDDIEVRVQLARSLVRRRRGAEAVEVLASVVRVPTEYVDVFADAQAGAKRHARERVADGRLTNVICDGDTRIVEVETSGGPKRLLADRSAAADVTAMLPCGSQDNRAVRVGYEDRADAVTRTDGMVIFVSIR